MSALVVALLFATFASGVAVDRAGLLGGSVADAAARQTPTATPAADPNLALIQEAWRDIHEHYVDAKHLDDAALAHGAIDGLTQAVGDEGHTTFMTAAESKAVDESLSGTFVGIGVQLSDGDTKFVVGDVIPGTPAEMAGLRRGDEIVAVDGKPIKGESIQQVVASVRGPEGQPVVLTLARAGTAKPFDVRIVRRRFDLPLIGWSMVPGRTVAFIRLEQFATGATKALKGAITAARAKGATAIVFDLRANPGGYVGEAVGVASQFIATGDVYRSVDATGAEKEVPVEKGGIATDVPMVVLADGASASAAEIVTGALQDAGRARVVGEKTFGTGTVLARFDLADGSSLRIGVERWLTRGGRPIWHEGLQPDVKVELAPDVPRLRPSDVASMTPAALAASKDTQLLKALELLASKG